MNATCPAGILQPQRVSDLGRLLNSEITAPLDSTARGVCNTSMAPAHLQGALSNICMAPVHLQGAHTSPCARQFFIPTRGSVCPPTSKGGNFLTKWRFPKKRGFSSSRLSRCPTTGATRPVRHNAGGVFLRHPHASSLSCSPSNRPGSCPGSFDKSRTCTHQTTQHDETSRARRQDLQTAPCASTARRRHRLARTAAIRGRVPDYQRSA